MFWNQSFCEYVFDVRTRTPVITFKRLVELRQGYDWSYIPLNFVIIVLSKVKDIFSELLSRILAAALVFPDWVMKTVSIFKIILYQEKNF